MWSFSSLNFFTRSSTTRPPWVSALQCQYSITVLSPDAVFSAPLSPDALCVSLLPVAELDAWLHPAINVIVPAIASAIRCLILTFIRSPPAAVSHLPVSLTLEPAIYVKIVIGSPLPRFSSVKSLVLCPDSILKMVCKMQEVIYVKIIYNF